MNYDILIKNGCIIDGMNIFEMFICMLFCKEATMGRRGLKVVGRSVNRL